MSLERDDDAEEGPDGEVNVMDYLIDRGFTTERAFEVCIKAIVQHAWLHPEQIRVIAREAGYDVPVVPPISRTPYRLKH
jgi:hypothetical protein